MEMFIFSVVFATVASLLFFFCLVIKRRTKSSNLPPGSYGWPVFGETLEFLRLFRDGRPEKFVKDRMQKYQSKIFKTSLMGERVVVLCGPAGNKFLFGNENKAVTVWWPSSVRQLLGSCLSNSCGDEAKVMRKMISYFVSPDAFSKLYIQTMELSTQHHIKTHWQGKEVVKVLPTIKLHTFELACLLFMSIEDTNRISNLFNLFNIFLKGIVSMAINFPGTTFYKAKRATKTIRKQLLSIVKQRRDALSGLSHPPQDLLSHLLLFPNENGKFMSELEVADNILLLLFAGHDTTTATLGEREYLNWDDIQKMKHTWDVVSEVLRLTSPIVGSFREAIVDFDFQGYTVPKGWK